MTRKIFGSVIIANLLAIALYIIVLLDNITPSAQVSQTIAVLVYAVLILISFLVATDNRFFVTSMILSAAMIVNVAIIYTIVSDVLLLMTILILTIYSFIASVAGIQSLRSQSVAPKHHVTSAPTRTGSVKKTAPAKKRGRKPAVKKASTKKKTAKKATGKKRGPKSKKRA